MSEQKHTPGSSIHEPVRLEVSHGYATVYDASNCPVAGLCDVELGWTDTQTGPYVSPEGCADQIRRIVACVNACVGVATAVLESDYQQGYEPWGHVKHLERQRDELLAALQLILPMAKGYAVSNPVGSNAKYIADVESLLVKATGAP